MAKLRLSAATAPWQCVLANTPQKWSFGFSPTSSNQLDPDWRLVFAKSDDKPLFVIQCRGGDQWSIESQVAAHSELILFLNGMPLQLAALQDGDILTLGSNVHLMVSVEGARATTPSATASSLDSPSKVSEPGQLDSKIGSKAKGASRDIKAAAKTSGSTLPLPSLANYAAGPRIRVGRSVLILVALITSAIGGGVAALNLRPQLPQNLAETTSESEIAIAMPEKAAIQRRHIDSKFPPTLEKCAGSSPDCIDQAIDQRRKALLNAFDCLAEQFAHYLQTPNRKLASQLAAFQVHVEQTERTCFSNVVQRLQIRDSSIAKGASEVADHYFKSAAICFDFKNALPCDQIPLAQLPPTAKIHLAKPLVGGSFFANSQFTWHALTQVVGFQKLWNALSSVSSPAVLLPKQELSVRDVLEMRAQLLVAGPEMSGPPSPDAYSLLASKH